MSLKSEILAQIEQSVRAKDELVVNELRLVMAKIKDLEIEKRAETTDEEIVRLLRQVSKQHDEAIALYQQGGRQDLIDKEKAQQLIIQDFLPQQLSELQVEALVDGVLASGNREFGPLMGMVMKKAAGNADSALVARVLKRKLQVVDH